MFSLLTGESLIPKPALTMIVVLFMMFGILPRYILRKTYICIVYIRRVSYIEQNVFTFGTPTLMAYRPKNFPCESPIGGGGFDQIMVYSGFFSCASTKAVPQSFMSQGDHLNICCFPNLCFYTLFYSLSCNDFN
jgi:hypothetical protein